MSRVWESLCVLCNTSIGVSIWLISCYGAHTMVELAYTHPRVHAEIPEWHFCVEIS